MYYDSELKGFGVRVSAPDRDGAVRRTWVLNYYANGRERRLTIGPVDDWPTEAARAKARELRRRISFGDDPLRERNEQRRAPTFRDLARAFEAAQAEAKSERTQKLYRQQLRDHLLPKLGRVLVDEIRRRDVEALHAALRRRPFLANRVLQLLRAIFNFGIAHEMVEANPCTGIKPFREPRRERYLSAEELRALLKAIAEEPNREGADAVLLLLLTGARSGEVRTMRWGDLDLEGGVWTKAASSTKQRRSHRCPLSEPALDVLRRRKPLARGPYVFPGRYPDEPRADLKRPWASIRDRAGLEEFHKHDLRHSFASLVVNAGGSLPLIGALLGHSRTETTARYAHLFDGTLRDAAERVGSIIGAASSAGAEE